MRNTLSILLLGLAFALQAYANPALNGTWSAAVGGQPLTVVFDANGAGKVNGKPMRWQTLGPLLAIERNGEVMRYQFELENGQLSVAGGDLNGVVVLTPGTRAAEAARAKPPAKADGTYAYQHEGSMSANAPGMWGGTASQSSDAGRWNVSGNQLTAQSQRGTVNTYTLEKRNHPKNKRDPMICLNGECYVTYYNKPAW
jgi:hypothetical protein